VNIWNKPTRGGHPAWGLGEVLTTPHHKELIMLRKKPRYFTFNMG
jgi:hypothetical protein